MINVTFMLLCAVLWVGIIWLSHVAFERFGPAITAWLMDLGVTSVGYGGSETYGSFGWYEFLIDAGMMITSGLACCVFALAVAGSWGSQRRPRWTRGIRDLAVAMLIGLPLAVPILLAVEIASLSYFVLSDHQDLEFLAVILPVTLMPILLLVLYRAGRQQVSRIRAWLRSENVAHACAACGYDLRASSGRCPECGQTIAGA